MCLACPVPELTNLCGSPAGAITIRPPVASMVSSPTVMQIRSLTGGRVRKEERDIYVAVLVALELVHAPVVGKLLVADYLAHISFLVLMTPGPEWSPEDCLADISPIGEQVGLRRCHPLSTPRTSRPG